MKLTRKSSVAPVADKPALGISRRQFMKHAGIATGGIAAASLMGTGMMRRVEAKEVPHDAPIEVKRTIVVPAPSVVVCMPKYKMACGRVKNLHSITHSTPVVTALKVRHCVSMAMVKNA